MSRKFYVIFTLKEYVLPKVFKTKVTVNRYLDENPKLTFKSFNSETQAYNFSKDIESQLHTKFIAKIENQIHDEFKPFKKTITSRTADLKPSQKGSQPPQAERKPQDKPKIPKSQRDMEVKEGKKQAKIKQLGKSEKIVTVKDIDEDEPNLAEEEDIMISKEQLLKELTENMKRIESEMLAKKKQGQKQFQKAALKQPTRQNKQKATQVEHPAEQKAQISTNQESTESIEQILTKFKSDIQSKLTVDKQKSKPPVVDQYPPSKEEPIRPTTSEISQKIEAEVIERVGIEEEKLTPADPIVSTTFSRQFNEVGTLTKSEKNIYQQISQSVLPDEGKRQTFNDHQQQQTEIAYSTQPEKQSLEQEVPQSLAAKAVQAQISPQSAPHIESPPQPHSQPFQKIISMSNEQLSTGLQQSVTTSTQLRHSVTTHPKEQEQYPETISQSLLSDHQTHQKAQEAQQTYFSEAPLTTEIKNDSLILDGSSLTNLHQEYFLQQNHFNLPQLSLQSKLYRLTPAFTSSSSAKLSLDLIQNQNPGFSIGLFKLETKEGTIHKLEHFGTKNRLHAQALCLRSGLQFASMNHIDQVQIEATFAWTGKRGFQKSIDKKLRQIAGPIESMEKTFKRIDYL